MLKRIISYSIDHKIAILLAAAIIIAAGIYSTKKIDVDVFPDLTAPTVVVMTDAHGMIPEEVERLITLPIESATSGATNVRRVRSTSMQGCCFVFIEFDWGTDPFLARQIVSEKLNSMSNELPPDITPMMAPQSSVMGEIMFVGLQTDTSQHSAKPTTMQELRTIADWVVKPAVMATDGVSQVTVVGGDEKEYHIVANTAKMAHYGVTLDALKAAATAASQNTTCGVARDYGNEYSIIVAGRTADIDEIMRTPVATNADGMTATIPLGEVADVIESTAVKQGYASANAEPAIILSISKQPGTNTLRITNAIDETLENLKSTLPDDVKLDTHIFRQADFISSSVGNVGRSLIEGAIFVIVVLLLFLGSFRTTIISIISIPISLLGTMTCLYLLGMEVNTMTLGGLCIAIGSLVDDAIIDVENVYRALRENRQLPADQQKPIRDVVLYGSTEIRSSIIHATFIIMLSFVPLFFLSGLEGRMLRPLGVAYIISIFMSLITALTLTPLLCRLLLGGDNKMQNDAKERRLNTKMKDIYERCLIWALSHKTTVITSTVVLLVTAVVMLFTMGRGFLPDFNEGSLTIAVVAKPGVSLEESNHLGQLVELTLLEIDEVESTSRRTGRGDLDEHSQSTYGAEIDVKFTLHKRDKAAFMADVRQRLSHIPGITTSVGQPLSHRIDHMVSGTQAAIAIKVFGTDLSQLYTIGNQIKEVASDVDGVVDLNVEQQTETPQIQLRPIRDRLTAYGITLQQFDEYAATILQGSEVGHIYQEQQSFPLVLCTDATTSGEAPTLQQIENATLTTESGVQVPLSEVCEIVSASGPNSISRENVRRRIIVSANVEGRDAASVVDDLKKEITEKVKLPQNYWVEYSGQFENAASATRTLVLVFLAVLVLIYLLLYSEFRSNKLSLVVLLNMPLALIGGVAAVRLSSGLLSISAIIGFITLFGIAVRNGILLVAKYQNLESQMSHRQSIIEGSKTRLLPIIMTAATTALSLVPMALAANQSGNEIQAPMAIVVLGGLLSSTLLNLIVVPVIYELTTHHKESAE